MKESVQSYQLLKRLYNLKKIDYKSDYWFWWSLRDSNVTLEFDISIGWPDHIKQKYSNRNHLILTKVLGTRYKDIHGAMTDCVVVSYLKKDGTERKRPDIRLIPVREFYQKTQIV